MMLPKLLEKLDLKIFFKKAINAKLTWNLSLSLEDFDPNKWCELMTKKEFYQIQK
jgi:hypothetical protein